MALEITNESRNGALDAITALLNSGFVKIYEGAPTGVGNAAPTKLLGTLNLNATAFAAAGTTVQGRADANAITGDTAADATGTAGSFRALKADGTTVVMEGNISATSGGGAMEMNNINVVQDGTLDISLWQITMPAT